MMEVALSKIGRCLFYGQMIKCNCPCKAFSTAIVQIPLQNKNKNNRRARNYPLFRSVALSSVMSMIRLYS